jgi:hypothetical protein
MSASDREWLSAGRGSPPQATWAFTADAPLVWLELARETGEVLAADVSGGIYLLDRRGKIGSLTRGPTPIRALAWSDPGNGGVALVGENRLYWFTRQLEFKGGVDLPEPSLGVALDAHGDYVAVSLANGMNLVFDGPRKPRYQFETLRPLTHLRFLATQPALIGMADYGLLCSHSLQGDPRWQQQLWTNAGDLAVTGGGEMVLMAGFSHGIQRFDDRGRNVGSYQVEGTVCRVASSFTPRRIAAATLERHLYWLDADGDRLWATSLPEDIGRLACDPLGEGLVCGLESGRLLRLDWHRSGKRKA